MKRLGLIVNPIAGMGGRVGLNGSDGKDILYTARKLGASPESPRRTVEALKLLEGIRNKVELITYPREMGEDEARESGFSPITIGSITSGATTPENTRMAAQDMEKLGVDLILFAGGDGTAMDIYRAVEQRVTVLGIPAGVKIHSGVYAVSPRHAGELVSTFFEGKRMRIRDAEVMDIDEEALRRGVLTTRLCGYLRVPEERLYIQNAKIGSVQVEEEYLQGIATDITTEMSDDFLYIFGPGTTTRAIVAELGLEKTLLGVDVILNDKVVAKNTNERNLTNLLIGRKGKIVVTVIGSQGYIFGRGNQQISPEIIRRVGKKNIVVVATPEKLASLSGRPLLVDTGDEDLDKDLSGYIRVTTGYNEYTMYKVES